jgi:hypothetical protein
MQKKALHVKISYEHNRLSEAFIANAYEKVMPTIKHSINNTKEETASLTSKKIQLAGER